MDRKRVPCCRAPLSLLKEVLQKAQEVVLNHYAAKHEEIFCAAITHDQGYRSGAFPKNERFFCIHFEGKCRLTVVHRCRWMPMCRVG